MREDNVDFIHLPGRPTIVCLCGSTRFSEAYREANLRETLAGKIVLTIGCDMKTDGELFAAKTPEELAEIKAGLDRLHLYKIDLADEVLVLNVGGYVGESTRSEIEHARFTGKRIRWLEPVITSRQVVWDCFCGEQNFTDLPAEYVTCVECGQRYSQFNIAGDDGTYEQSLDSDGLADFDAFVPDYPDDDDFEPPEPPDYPEESEA
jgi:hypothetical protein